MRRYGLWGILLGGLLLAGCGQQAGRPGGEGITALGSVVRGVYGNAWGSRAYRLFLPGGTGAPLLVMLHGCTQTADDFATGTRMDALAQELGFAVLYPEQSTLANASRCWNWFYSLNQGRSGEAAILADMAQALAARYGLAGGMGVAGLSAGGAMSVILAAAYPERFAFLGVVAGLEYGAATTPYGALQAMAGGGPDPRLQGQKVCELWGGRPLRRPLLVFHGDQDTTVNPVNGAQVYLHWLYAHQSCGYLNGWQEERSSATAGGRQATVRRVRDSRGVLAEFWLVQGMGHRWPGGDPSGSYTDPAGPDASRMLAERFLASR